MMSNGLRIIGVRILDECPSYIRKALHEGELYLLYNDYEELFGNVYMLRKCKQLSDKATTLFNQKDAMGHEIKVNVGAIVGKNGDGKSSLVEVVLRVLNNFACQIGFRSDQEHLRMVENLRAILYYEVDDDLFAISSEGEYSRIGLWKNGEQILNINPEWDDQTRKTYLKHNHINELFYTTVINYSIYAYNSELFKGENEGNESWIEALFHKNDEYQTPVVLNPMRTDGNIDINNEEYLSRQRLMTLLVKALPNDAIRKVSDTQKAVGFAFTLEKESKLISKSIREYYEEAKNIQNPLRNFEQMYQAASSADQVKHRDDIKSMLDYFSEFCEELMYIINNQHPVFFETANNAIESLDEPVSTDFKQLVSWMESFKKWHYIDERNSINGFISTFSSEGYRKYNYAFLYRLIVILRIWRGLSHAYPELFEGNIDIALETANEPKHAAQLYCCYKVLSILTTYRPYIDHTHVYDSGINLIINSIDNNMELKDLENDVKNVLSLTDYRALKLRQALNFLEYLKNNPEDIYYGAHELDQPKFFFKEIKSEEGRRIGYKKEYYVSFDDLNNIIIKSKKGKILSRDVILYLPPPIFVGDIIIEEDNNEDNHEKNQYRYAYLSSGQLQKWNCISALMYHLRNLNDDIHDESQIHYKYINVIFEEVELYFHPEYQREFIQYVLDMINRSSLNNIESLNICFVTHSPFILSDILKNNILYLESGLQVEGPEEETFGANLYNLLADSFYLKDNAMGKFSSEYYKDVIKRFNSGEKIADDEKEMIGDIIIRNYLNGCRPE